MQPNVISSSFKFTSSSSNQGLIQNNADFENQAINQTILKWSSLSEGRDSFVVSSQSDLGTLRNLKNVLLSLQNQFTSGGSKIVFTGDKKDDFNKRLILLENEIQGLMKRRIQFTAKGGDGSRTLDYTGILNEKENQIVELEKKINNLQQRLRKASARQIQLQNQVSRLFQQIKLKDKIISSKNDIILGEVAASNLLRETLQKSGIALPNIGSLQIRAQNLTIEGATSRSSAYQQLPEAKKNKTSIISFFRQFQKINSSSEGINSEQIDRALQGFILSLQGSRLRQSVETRLRRRKIEEEYERLQSQFGAAVSIFQSQLEKIKLQNPSLRIETDSQIYQMLRQHKINVYKVAGDVVQLQRFSERTVQVPVQDARTKHLLHLFATQMKKFTQKYPKLQSQMDVKLTEFFQQQLIDLIEVDEVDRLVEIVKYVPQVVKVENVYAYSSEKSRKIQFHLRVLVKALLEELQKVRRKTGVVLEMDQGVIAMINQEILGVVDVDDILKIFRVVPKLVEVQKVTQKIVDRIVQVPQVVAVQKIVEKIVEVEKIKQIQKIVNVPLEMPVIITNVVQKIVPVERIIEKTIEVPHIIEKIVQVTKQVPKIVTVQKFVDRIVQVQKIVQVQRVVNHVQHQIQTVEVRKQVIVPTQEKIIQKIVEVPVVVEKIVQKIVQVPQVIEVEKIIEKIVPQIQYRVAKQVENHVQIRYQVVDRIIEKPIPIIQTVQKIVQVPQIVQRIVQTNTIVKQPYEVPVVRQRIVVQDRIKQIEVIRDRPVVQTRQVVKQIQKIVQIPVIVQKIVKVQQIVEKPIIQKSEQTIIKQVYLRDPQIIKEPKIIEVQKIINNYIEVPKPVKYIEEKIVQVIRHVDRIKQVKVPVEKIIEKMVEVPKVVQVQKIVQKVVVVPRVVQKVVEVPQIVQRVVPKIIIEERIKQVEKIIEKPVIQQRPVEIQTVKNVYIEVDRIVQKIVDKLVEVPRYEEKVITKQVMVQTIRQVIKQVPKQIEVQKIVYNTIEVAKPVQVERQIIVPVQVPIPVEKVIEKIVPVTQVIQKIVQVPQVVEKIVAQRAEQVRVQQILRTEQKVVVQQRVKQVVKQVPYINDKIKQVVVERQKIVPIQSIVQQVVTAQQIIEKVVQKAITVPKIHQVQRTKEIVVEVPKIVQVQKIIPQLVNVNRYIEKMVQKIVEVPIIVQKIKQIVKQNQKIVEVKNEYQQIKQVQRVVQKAVVMEKFKQVVRNINHIEKVLQIVDRYEQTPVEIIAHEQKLVEVPYILQKIVQKIVVMPQIVQVLKYVHQVVEQETLGVAVGVDVATHQQRYKLLTKDLKVNIGILIAELKKMKTNNSGLVIQIEIIEKFLSELEQFILFPRIVQVPKEVIVQKTIEKDRSVLVPTESQRSIKMELTLSLLVEKLILELKKIKKTNPSLNFDLEDDIKLIFFPELESASRSVGDDFNMKLKQFSDSVYRKFESLGNWSYDHQMMLNTFLQQRFMMANLVKNSNIEIQKSKAIQSKREQALAHYQQQVNVLQGILNKFRTVKLQGISVEQSSIIQNIFTQFDTVKQKNMITEPMMQLLELSVSDQRIKSLIREKDAEILKLKDRIMSIQKTRTFSTSSESQNEIIRVLQSENLNLKNQITTLRTSKGSQELIAGFKVQIKELNGRILELEQQKSNLTAELSNLRRQYQVKLQFSSSIKDSIITKEKSQFRSPQHMTSPVSKYALNSPQQADYGIRMVDSKIEDNRGTGLTQSRQSQQASYRLTSGSNPSSVKENTISQQTSRSSTYYGQGGNQYQASSSYQYGSGSNLYSSTSSSQRQQTSATGQYGVQGASSDLYRSGTTYQPSNTYQTYQNNTLQTGYQPYTGSTQNIQGSTYQSSFRSGVSGTSSTSQSGSSYQYSSGSTPQGSSTTQGSGFQSSYQYKKP